MPIDLLEATTTAVRKAGKQLRSIGSRPSNAEALRAALRANDDAVTEVLRPVLTAALPGSGWNTDEHGSGQMPDGDWWVVDPVGGNLHALYGLADWNIGVSLVRDGRPVLAVLHTPLAGETFTAVAGEGTLLNGVPVHVSEKTDLSLALAGTGQAQPNRDPANARRDCTPPLWTSSVPCTERKTTMEKLLEQVKAVVIPAGKALLDGYADTARPPRRRGRGRPARHRGGRLGDQPAREVLAARQGRAL